MKMRIGTGYDVHRLTTGRPLILGGVVIPFEKGLSGHSDADVLTHSICDALLGAAALGDIGIHFPDTDSRYKGISSLILLETTWERIREKGFSSVINLDTVIFAEKPKLSPFRDAMIQILADTLGIDTGCLNIKATTTEGLGWVGRGEGIGAMSVALIE